MTALDCTSTPRCGPSVSAALGNRRDATWRANEGANETLVSARADSGHAEDVPVDRQIRQRDSDAPPARIFEIRGPDVDLAIPVRPPGLTPHHAVGLGPRAGAPLDRGIVPVVTPTETAELGRRRCQGEGGDRGGADPRVSSQVVEVDALDHVVLGVLH